MRNRNNVLCLAGLLLVALGTGCYSFRGISIEPDVKTYFVVPFRDNALNAPPNLYQDLTERLKDKVRLESRLVFAETDPNVEFIGTLVSYRVTSEAPQPGESSALNRLTITVAMEYVNHLHEENGWTKNFSFFFDFPANQNLSTIETQAIEEISIQLMEDIFNNAFSNW